MTSVIPAEAVSRPRRLLRRTPGSAGRERIIWALVSLFSPQSQPLAESLQRCVYRSLGGNSEVLEKVLGRRAFAEAMHADEFAIMADHGVPAPAHRGLDRDLDRGFAN